MKKVHNKNIDNVFKHVLEDPVNEPGYQEHDWDAFEQMFDKGKKPARIVYWLPVMSSVAAILLVVFGWWMLRPQVTDKQKIDKPVAAVHQDSVQPKVDQQQATTHQLAKNKVTKPGTQPDKTDQPRVISNQSAQPQYAAGNNTAVKKQTTATNPPVIGFGNEGPTQVIANNQTEVKVVGNSRDYATLAEAAKASGIEPVKIEPAPVLAAVNLPKAPIFNGADDSNSRKTAIKKSGVSSFRPQLSLSIIAASELNGMNTLRQSNNGGTYGVLFSVGIKKLTISTGASYSIKPYAVGFDSYHTSYKFKTSPETITADCRLLDIPLNIDYQVYNKRSNKISVGTGISSYLMMHESYDYDYADPAAIGPSYYNVKSPGKYMFSILNLQATYQRQINSKFGLRVQPYVKLPLSNIGYSQIRLQTVGVAVGVNWNINSLSKPK